MRFYIDCNSKIRCGVEALASHALKETKISTPGKTNTLDLPSKIRYDNL